MNGLGVYPTYTNPILEMPFVPADGESSAKAPRAWPQPWGLRWPSVGEATSGEVRPHSGYSETLVAASNPALAGGGQETMALAAYAARQRWLQLKRSHFKREGRQARVEAALKALEEAAFDYGLDAETVRWIAEDADLEDM